MNLQIAAALALGNAINRFEDSPPEVPVGVAVVWLMQMDKTLSQEQAEQYVLTAMAEIANMPFSAKDVCEEAQKHGVEIQIH